MRVTHVITRLIVGGAQENTVASVIGLRDKPGFQVHLVSGPAQGPEGSLAETCSRIPGLLTTVPDLVRPINPWKDLLALRKLTRLFRAQQPEIVHTHSGKAGILGRLAAARAGVPVIIHTIHGPSFGAFQNPLSNAVFRALEVYAGRVTTHFVVVANAMKEQYLSAGIGHPAQYTRIFSGFSLEPFLAAQNDPSLRSKLGIGETDIVVGKIARLFKLKGHDDLLAVAPALVRAFPQMKFLLVGDGVLRGRLEARARSAGLQNHVIFTGLVAPERIPEYVGIMDILVHLSLREGLPRALPQALAAGRPVAAYDVDGAREVCREGETGFLLRCGDQEAVKERLGLLAADPALRKRLGENGRHFVVERFGVEHMVDELQKLYLALRPPRPEIPTRPVV